MAIDPRKRGVARWRNLFLLSALLTSFSPLTACGQASPAVGGAFAARATAVCEQALASKRAWSKFPVANFDPAHPDKSAFPKAAVWLEDQVAPTFEAWLNGLTALGEPPTGRGPWSDVLAAVQKVVSGDADEIAAAKAGDSEKFVAASNGLTETQSKLESATAAAGVPNCSDIHKS